MLGGRGASSKPGSRNINEIIAKKSEDKRKASNAPEGLRRMVGEGLLWGAAGGMTVATCLGQSSGHVRASHWESRPDRGAAQAKTPEAESLGKKTWLVSHLMTR